MAETADIAQWIAHLADRDRAKRTAAAEAIRTAAFDRCFSESNDWIRDERFLKVALHGAARRQPISFVVGIAVQPETFRRIHAANGSPRLANVPPEQDAMEFELRFGTGDVDILTTRPGGSGAIARYLERFGEGIQQVEVNVSNLDGATELLRTRFGLTPIYPASRPGADGTRINFFLAPAAGGAKCLIELVQSDRDD
jgi:hypothetical protein